MVKLLKKERNRMMIKNDKKKFKADKTYICRKALCFSEGIVKKLHSTVNFKIPTLKEKNR